MRKIEELLSLDDATHRDVPVPEWGDISVRVGSMSAADRSDLERQWSGKGAVGDPCAFRVDVLFRSLQDDDGNPLGSREEIVRLMGKNAQAIERLFDASCELNALTKKDVEALEKN